MFKSESTAAASQWLGS